MQLFMSGEVGDNIPTDEIPKKFSKAQNSVYEKLKSYLNDKNYGAEVEQAYIIPIVIKEPKGFEHLHKERKLFKRKTKSCDFRLRVDYDLFNKGSDKEREKLLIKNFIDSIRILDSRTTREFDGKQLEADALNLFGFYYDEL